MVRRSPDGCVEIRPAAEGTEAQVRVRGGSSLRVDAPGITRLRVNLSSVVDGTLGEDKLFDVVGVVRIKVGVARTDALVAFTAPTLRVCG